MIAFKDFVPRQTRKQGFIKPPEWETMEQAVVAANDWIREQGVTVINVETVVVPGLRAKNEPNSGRATFLQGAYTGYSGQWAQFIRVWYVVE